MASEVTVVSTQRAHGGTLTKYEHASQCNACPMRFQIFWPPAADTGRCPLLVYLTGLEGTENNCMEKGGALPALVAHGIALVTPDTSTRVALEGDDRVGWWFGRGASYYVDATQQPWRAHYQMHTYVTVELPALLRRAFSDKLDVDRMSIFGHSVGGFGALQCALRHPTLYRSVSAFAPVTEARTSSWCADSLLRYLGSVEAAAAYNPAQLAFEYQGPLLDVLIDQGANDSFLAAHLNPDAFLAAAGANKQHLRVDYASHAGYTHSYFFVATFMGKHIDFHAKHLKK